MQGFTFFDEKDEKKENLYHRDLKEKNILLEKDEKELLGVIYKITDFSYTVK